MIHFRGETTSPCDKYQITQSSQEQSQQIRRPASGLGDSDGKAERFQQLISTSTREVPWETCAVNTALALLPLLSFSSGGNKVEESLK